MGKRGEQDIHKALDRVFEDAEVRSVGPGDRLAIFSDHHKGARDGADDFQRCERSYNAALAYYDRLGYELLELGDGDITGLEIRDGEIMLVRWPCTPQTDPEPPLARMPLARVRELAL